MTATIEMAKEKSTKAPKEGKERKEPKLPKDEAEETMNGAPSPGAKRKADIEEIEVDLEAPEPPSKRAKRALKKGKALPAKADSDDENGDKKDGSKEKAEKARSEHGVWIGNLPFFLTAPDLRKWLVDNSGGVIEESHITRLKLPVTKEPGRDKSVKPANKGFAYVDFVDVGPKVAAIALSETELNGRKLLIKDSKSFEGRPKKEPEADAEGKGAGGKEGAGSQVDPNASRKVFVGNMGFKTTEEDLQRNFEKCGEIEWVKLATFEDSGKCKGYGWVKFKTPEAAAWAVKGFVKIKEEIETEEDFDDEAKDEDRQKHYKTRKWWVNRMMGRELKLELAEDDQTRYKKRFKKGGMRTEDGGEDAGAAGGERRFNKRERPQQRRSDDDGESQSTDRKAKPLKEASNIDVARLTGAVVKHTGSKVTFD